MYNILVMALPFKYISNFTGYITASSVEKQDLISKASLDSLKDIIPEGIDFDKNIDLIGVAFNAAVANRFNKNGDGIDSNTAIAIKDYFVHKPTNIEHQRSKVVGHVVGSALSKFGSNELISEEEASLSNQPFNIALSSVIYKTVNQDFAELVERSVDEDSEFYQKVSASWEVGFNDYKIVIGSDDVSGSRVVEDEEEKEELKQFLKAYGGNGRTEDGLKVNRLITGDIYPLGIGFTMNPAAEVKGLVKRDSINIDVEKNEEDSANFKRLEIKNNIFEEKSSHSEKTDVILNKNLTTKKVMEKEILDQVTEMLEAQASSKKLSEEAIASITKVFHDAIVQKNDQWLKDKESLVKDKEDLVKASEEASQEIDQLKEQLTKTSQEVEELKMEIEAREASDRFVERMSELDDDFELEDEDRIVLAGELKTLDSTEECFAEYKEKLSVMWKHKTKAFKEEQEKAIQERVEEQVQKKIEELSTSEASEATEEEVVEEAIENAEVEEEAVANNNGEAIEEKLSLKEKFKQAFSKENVTIQY